MKKFVALLTKEKQPRMNEKMLTPTFFELYAVYIKKSGQFFLHTLLANLFTQRLIILLQIILQVSK